MSELTGMRLVVAGAGVFGLTVALRAAMAGAEVEVWDPASFGDNASGIAAGMIAPAGEVLFDALDPIHFKKLQSARDGWIELADAAPGLKIDRSGAVFRFSDEGARASAEARLKTMGAQIAPVAEDRLALLTPEDWRIDAQPAMAALKAAVVSRGGLFRREAFVPSASAPMFDAVVLAAGMESRAFISLAPELAVLKPIKGQRVRFRGGSSEGPIIRANEIYLAPQSGGLLAGATMEVGRHDRTVDPEVIASLREAAVRLNPDLAELAFDGAAAVRASTPDGWPLAGRSGASRIFLAGGARRNGWLLAPTVSATVISGLAGGDGGAYAATFDPARFSRP